MALQYFTGKAFHGGMLKEAAYGYNYQGGTSASAYVGYCAHFGVKLYPIDAHLLQRSFRISIKKFRTTILQLSRNRIDIAARLGLDGHTVSSCMKRDRAT
jgi:hypothetical protein